MHDHHEHTLEKQRPDILGHSNVFATHSKNVFEIELPWEKRTDVTPAC